MRGLSLEDWTAYYQQTFLEKRHSLQVITPGRWGDFPEAEGPTYDSAEPLKSRHSAYTVEW